MVTPKAPRQWNSGQALSKEEVLSYLQQKIAEAGGPHAFAEKQQCSRSYIYKILVGDREPGIRLLFSVGIIRRMQVTYTWSKR